MQVAKRFPEVSGVGFIALVRPGQLSQFVARILADPPVPLAPGQPYQITPPGTRPFYCLVNDEYRSSGLVLPLDFDVCAGQSSSQIASDLAGNTYIPYKLGKKDYLAVEVPVFPGGVISTNALARSQSALGLVGLTTLPSFDLAQALSGHPGTRVAFHYGSGSSKVTFSAGSAPRGRSRTLSISTTGGMSRPLPRSTGPECSGTRTHWRSYWGDSCSAYSWER